MGKIFYIMGKSSSGKDTIFQEIFRRQTWNLKKIILYTTRPARADEKDGEDYFFVNEETLTEIFHADKGKKEWLGFNRLFESNLRRTGDI